jgi:hypothetical protein
MIKCERRNKVMWQEKEIRREKKKRMGLRDSVFNIPDIFRKISTK